MGFLPLKQRVNRDKKGFATKQRMFGLMIIDEGPSLSMPDGRAVAHFKLVCTDLNDSQFTICATKFSIYNPQCAAHNLTKTKMITET